MKVEFFRHNLDDKDRAELNKVLDSLFLTTGQWTQDFEAKFASYMNAPFAVGVTSATQALELALKCFDIGQGDEVITTPMSFIATANAIEICGAKPVFVDVSTDTGNINEGLIESAITDKTKAILPVHLYGQMCDMKRIREIADKYQLKVIEDCAHAVESMRDGVRAGQLGDISCFSFYATKNLTCGEGGALVCHDEDIYEWLLKGRLHGMSKGAADRYAKLYQHYDMEFLGLKCNMSNMAAALLINQIDRLDDLLKQRQDIAKKYDKAFGENSAINLPVVLEGVHPRHLYTVWVNASKRDEYLHALQSEGIGVAVNYRAIHLMKYYREKYDYQENDFPICEQIGNQTLSIPLYPLLSDDEVQFIIQTTNKVIKE